MLAGVDDVAWAELEHAHGPADVVPGLLRSLASPDPDRCGEALHELFGNYHYQVGLKYEDNCSNKSALVADAVQTAAQKFQTVEGFCFIATAAYGGQWTGRVQALRYFRDLYMRQTGFGYAMIEFYYANSPALARAIGPRPWARALTRAMIGPIADFAQITTQSATHDVDP